LIGQAGFDVSDLFGVILDADGLISADFGLAGEGLGNGGLGEILLGGGFSGNLANLKGNLTFFDSSLPPSDYKIDGGAGGGGAGSGGSPVPEPASLFLFGVGLIMLLGGYGWRYRKVAA
jgi:hypothetical protein